MALLQQYGQFHQVKKGAIQALGHCHCGQKFVCPDERRGFYCPEHPTSQPSSYRVKFEQIFRRFKDYDAAYQFLSLLRGAEASKTFDARDWKAKEKPLAANQLLEKWLEFKKESCRQKTIDNLRRYVFLACNAWGDRNVKEIQYGQIEDLIFSYKAGQKSRHGLLSAVKCFFRWVAKRERIPMPEFPVVTFELGFRKTVDLDTQNAIIAEVKRISYELNPRIWLAIKWLSTYIAIRPGELIALKEENFNRFQGFIFVPHPKEKKPKIIPLTDEDAALLRSLPLAIPSLPFFRHLTPGKRRTVGKRFGKHYLLDYWKQACDHLGIKGVDLYGGTRHSSATGLLEYCSPEEIRRATMHKTSKAFDRYLQFGGKEAKAVYEKRGQHAGAIKGPGATGSQ